MKRFAMDTGPLVAVLNRRDAFHAWARDALGSIRPPLVTCEAVISEACHRLRSTPSGPDAVLELVNRDVLRVEFRAADHVAAIRKLLHKYKTVPMSFADACLVRMVDADPGLAIVTLDGDFRIYRRLGRQQIGVISP